MAYTCINKGLIAVKIYCRAVLNCMNGCTVYIISLIFLNLKRYTAECIYNIGKRGEVYSYIIVYINFKVFLNCIYKSIVSAVEEGSIKLIVSVASAYIHICPGITEEGGHINFLCFLIKRNQNYTVASSSVFKSVVTVNTD